MLSRLTFLPLSLAFAFAFSACGGDPPTKEGAKSVVITTDDDMGTPEPDQGPLDVTEGAVTIRGAAAFEVENPGGLSERGTRYVYVPVEVANGLDLAIPVGFGLFRLRAGALEHLSSQATTALPEPCPSDSLLSPGGVVRCQVLFEIPEDAVPSVLVFQTPTETVESPVVFEPCTRCGNVCVDLQTDESHCGQCDRAVPQRGVCVDGEPTCKDGQYDCDGYCENKSTECMLNSTRQISCAALCRAEDLQCVRVWYYYTCSESTFESNDALGCDDQPPATWNECRYQDVDCRCQP